MSDAAIESKQSSAPQNPPSPPVPSGQSIEAILEALVLCSDKALSAAKLAAACGLEEKGAGPAIKAAIDLLNEQYGASGRSFRIESVAGGYRAVALAAFAPHLAALHGVRESLSLSKAAVETLAIVAYRQPVTRAALESIRGVNCGEVLRSLLERRLVDISGRAEEPGRPMLYATTKRFLETFGLASLKDLPSHTDFAPAPSDRAVAAPATGVGGP